MATENKINLDKANIAAALTKMKTDSTTVNAEGEQRVGYEATKTPSTKWEEIKAAKEAPTT